MDQNQNDNLFDNDNPPPQQPSEPTEIGGGARVYQTPPDVVPDEPRPYTPPPGMGVPPALPPKRSNTAWIIAIVVLLVLCCCCLILGGLAWVYGDTIYNEFSFSLPAALKLLV